ncbi:O-acyltransferase WSD1 [Bienertia sinuspersici]
MNPNLRLQTEGRQENEGADEPVSPTGQYLNSKALSICILAVIESEVPIDDSFAIPQLRDVFLPINPKFSSIMVSDKKGVRQWKKVEVNLEDHVKVPSFPKGLSTETFDDHFDEYLSRISMEPLPQDRPLWEIHIFKYPTSRAAGHCIFKLHHALGDGYSLMGALLSCVQRVDNPSLPVTFPSTRSSSEVKRKKTRDVICCLPRALSAVYRGVSDFGRSMLKITCIADDKTPIRSGNEGMSLHPCKVSTIALSLGQIKLIKAKLGTTIHDILAGVVLLGVRLYMQGSEKKSSNSKSTALVLFNTRNVEGYKSVEEMMNKAHTKLWGNQFAFLHLAIPKLVNDKHPSPIDFIYETKKRITRLKDSPATYLTAQYLETVRKCRGPEAAAELIYKTLNKSSLGVTNLIGPVEQVALAKHTVNGMYFIVCGGPKSLQITMMSYMGTVRIGVVVEKGFIDSHKLASCIEDAFQLTLEAATSIQ